MRDGPGKWSYENPLDVEAYHRTDQRRWVWLHEALCGLPHGKVLRVEVPKDIPAGKYQMSVRGALNSARRMRDWKLSIRRSVDGAYLIISKEGVWPESVRRLEREGAQAMEILERETEAGRESVDR